MSNKKKLGIPRKETYTSEEVDREIDTLRSSFQAEIANLGFQHERQLHELKVKNLQSTTEDTVKTAEMTWLEERVKELENICLQVVEERDSAVDKYTRLDLLINTLNDHVDNLQGELRRSNADRIRLLDLSSKTMQEALP